MNRIYSIILTGLLMIGLTINGLSIGDKTKEVKASETIENTQKIEKEESNKSKRKITVGDDVKLIDEEIAKVESREYKENKKKEEDITTKTQKTEKSKETRVSRKTEEPQRTKETTQSRTQQSPSKETPKQNNQNEEQKSANNNTSSSKQPSKPKESKYQSQSIYILGRRIPYKNGGQGSGQAIIDSNASLASTWGGASTFSGNDGLNTHFIGHNHGAFNGIWNISTGGKIIVTDSSGNPTTYTVREKYTCNEYGVRLDNEQYAYDIIAGTGGGETIHLQTCKPGTTNTNWIIRAVK